MEIPLAARDMLERHERAIFDPVIERCLQEAEADRRADGVVATDLARLSHRMFLQVAAAVIGLDGVDTPERTDLLERCMYRLNAGFDVKFSTRDHAEVIAEDVTLSSGRFLAKGEQVALDLVQANLDTDVFGADAAAFNPWRRVPASTAPPYGLAFGNGRHVCIGRPLVTPVSGSPTTKDEGERLLMRVVRRLIEAGVRLDPDTPPQFAPTAEDVYESLPVLLTNR